MRKDKLDKIIAYLDNELDIKAKKEKKTVINVQKKKALDISSVKLNSKKVKFEKVKKVKPKKK